MAHVNDETGEALHPLRAASARDESEGDLGLAEARLGMREPAVAARGQLEAAAENGEAS